ncbi:hypothetical protein PoB_006200100 [Plakobranchus ocellatus]|uniref:Uncharacterized protein n=1 Tax=Plakobranchus ocellatus TaxID=259542 RepID=A0AAV4CUF2_9GAST|nr:hypothetical protein PoB_006200100 [Plakobranchus ocellatus]
MKHIKVGRRQNVSRILEQRKKPTKYENIYEEKTRMLHNENSAIERLSTDEPKSKHPLGTDENEPIQLLVLVLKKKDEEQEREVRNFQYLLCESLDVAVMITQIMQRRAEQRENAGQRKTLLSPQTTRSSEESGGRQVSITHTLTPGRDVCSFSVTVRPDRLYPGIQSALDIHCFSENLIHPSPGRRFRIPLFIFIRTRSLQVRRGHEKSVSKI